MSNCGDLLSLLLGVVTLPFKGILGPSVGTLGVTMVVSSSSLCCLLSTKLPNFKGGTEFRKKTKENVSQSKKYL